MTEGHRDLNRTTYTRRRLFVAGGALVVPAIVYLQLGGQSAGSARPAAPNTTPPPAPVRAAVSTAGPARPFAPVVFDHDVAQGSTGEKVIALQDRLRALAFDPGPSDGQFGPATQRSVWAFEKLILDVAAADVTGVVTPAIWQRMNEPIDVRPRRSGPGTHLEVILPSQVAVLFVDDVARLITHISSGTGDKWCDVVTVDNDDGTKSEQGICGVAVTPGGVFHFERRVNGWRNSKLGRLWNPVYFNYGIAVHGASNVPSQPASHGCVRIPMHIADYFPSLVTDGDLVYVFDGVEQPETYGAQVPTFDYPDPDYVSTTTSTTTTTPPSTTTTTSPDHGHSTTTVLPAESLTTSAVAATAPVGATP
jgi:hypothetical protein